MPIARMRVAAASFVAAIAIASFVGVGPGEGWLVSRPAAAVEAAQPRDLGSQLRYIGRDGLTGMPAPVDDRFIEDHKVAIERYGKDEREAIPAPPASGVDIVSIRIPAIGVDAGIGRFGVDRYGRLDVPQDRVTVGWNPAFSALPGEGASTFFAAHVTFAGQPGVFNRLNALAPGAEVDVTLTDGTVARYRARSVVDYPLGAIDMGAILKGLEGRESITLMTCSGPPNEGEYPLRTVVLAERLD